MISYGSFSSTGPDPHRRFDALRAYLNPASDAATFALAAGNTDGALSGIIADHVVFNAVCYASDPHRGARAPLEDAVARCVGPATRFAAHRSGKDNCSLALIRVNEDGKDIDLAGIGDVRVYGYRRGSGRAELLLADPYRETVLFPDPHIHRWLLPTTGSCVGDLAQCGCGIDCDFHGLQVAHIERAEYEVLIAVTAGVHLVLDELLRRKRALSLQPADTVAENLVRTAQKHTTARGQEPASRTALFIALP